MNLGTFKLLNWDGLNTTTRRTHISVKLKLNALLYVLVTSRPTSQELMEGTMGNKRKKLGME